MKLIDEKGKLFGLINVIDLLVLVMIIGLLGAVVFRITSGKVNAGDTNILSPEEDIYVTLYSSIQVPEVAQSLKVGDKLVANNGFTNAEIVSVQSVQADYVGTNSNGEAILSKHPLWQDVEVVIKDKVKPSSVILKAGNQEVRVGYNFILKTQKVEVNSRVRGIQIGEQSPEISE